MKSTAFFAFLVQFLVLDCVFAGTPITVKKGQKTSDIVPNKFIVEVDHLSDVPDIPGKRSLEKRLDIIYSTLKSRDIDYEVNKEYNVEGLFVGAALTLNTPEDVAILENTPGIRAIHPVRIFKQPKPVSFKVVTDVPTKSATQAPLIITGVDKVHAKGIKGKGIKIGILDTGVDYNHPALGGAIGPTHKVIGGYDFVGDAYDGYNGAVPDSDPMDCAGHGTHVAGIIAADPNNALNVIGVAPEASLSAYRIFGCDGSTSDDSKSKTNAISVIIEALLRGAKDGQDILNLSLGGASGWSESPGAVVASRIAASGKLVLIAAGNDGSFGAWNAASPASGVDVIAVASVNNPLLGLQAATLHGAEHDPIIYYSTLPLPVEGTVPIYAISTDPTVPDDACNVLPDSTPDLSKYVVLVRRGGCTFVQKLRNIAAKGGKVTLIYDNGSGFGGISIDDYVAVLIAAEDGEYLVTQLAAGTNISISFPQEGGSTSIADPKGGLVSAFTSYGPSNDFLFKPAVAAPGGNIVSTYLTNAGSYALMSGTSMATPFMAGSSALFLQVKGKSAAVARRARTTFETTASKIPSSQTDGDPLQTVAQQGAGLVNVYNALYAKTVVSQGELILNDTAHFKGVHSFTVTNTDSKPKTYKLTHAPAGTAETFEAGGNVILGPIPLSNTFASVSVSPSKFTLAPGRTQSVVARITPPKGVKTTTFPVYSGFIDIQSGSEINHVTYLGLAASLKDKEVLDTTDHFTVWNMSMPLVLDGKGYPQLNATSYSFATDSGDYPSLVFRKLIGSPLLRIDLVDSKIVLKNRLGPREPGGRHHNGPVFSFPHPQKPDGTFAQVKIIGNIDSTDYVSRNDEDTSSVGNGVNTFNWDEGTFANGTVVPNGAYRLLLRALRITGNPNRQEDYDSWLSPIVSVNITST